MPSDLNTASQYTPHIPSFPTHADHSAARHRFGLGVRLRTFLKVAELDRALTEGADPQESRELALRARQLARPGKRARFARAIERVVADVGSPRPPLLLGVYRRGPVLHNRALLRALAERLRAEAPVRLRGLAMVDLLLYCNDGPLYGAESDVELEYELTTALRALEPETANPGDGLSPVSEGGRA